MHCVKYESRKSCIPCEEIFKFHSLWFENLNQFKSEHVSQENTEWALSSEWRAQQLYYLGIFDSLHPHVNGVHFILKTVWEECRPFMRKNRPRIRHIHTMPTWWITAEDLKLALCSSLRYNSVNQWSEVTYKRLQWWWLLLLFTLIAGLRRVNDDCEKFAMIGKLSDTQTWVLSAQVPSPWRML